MKYLNRIFIIFSILSSTSMWSQGCIDSTLINWNTLCPFIWNPVCGCDGVTYANDCEAVNYGGVTSYTPGECSGVGCMNLAGLDFGMCDMFLGFAWTGTSCNGLSGCGYIAGDIDYSPYFFSTPEACQAQCGGGDCFSQQQVDEGALVLCTTDYNPVCGCDGQTFGNECLAYYGGGNTLISVGACDGSAEYCPRIPIEVGFGDCEMALGWGLTTQGCVAMSGCGYVGSNGYDYSAFFFESSYQCGNQCIDEVVIECYNPNTIDLNIQCPAIYEPVCGCDSVTYSNSCVAMYHNGITIFTPGECTVSTSELLFSENNLTISPNPAVDRIQIKMTSFKPGELLIYTLDGQLAMAPIKIQNNKQVVQLNDLASGLYIVEWHGQGQQRSRTRMIKS